MPAGDYPRLYGHSSLCCLPNRISLNMSILFVQDLKVQTAVKDSGPGSAGGGRFIPCIERGVAASCNNTIILHQGWLLLRKRGVQREMAPGSALCYQETLVDILYIGVCLCEVGAPPQAPPAAMCPIMWAK